jgi:hypothetical protein
MLNTFTQIYPTKEIHSNFCLAILQKEKCKVAQFKVLHVIYLDIP